MSSTAPSSPGAPRRTLKLWLVWLIVVGAFGGYGFLAADDSRDALEHFSTMAAIGTGPATTMVIALALLRGVKGGRDRKGEALLATLASAPASALLAFLVLAAEDQTLPWMPQGCMNSLGILFGAFLSLIASSVVALIMGSVIVGRKVRPTGDRTVDPNEPQGGTNSG